MKTAGIILLGFAALAAVVAIRNVFGGAGGPDGPDRFAEPDRFAGFVAGSFLVPIVLAIVGLILLNKSKRR